MLLEKLIKDLKCEKQRVTIITDECHKDLLRVCLDFEPEDWKFSCNRLTEILDSIKNKLISMKIKISQVEKDRLIALLDTAGLISDNEESALEIYHDALSVSPNGYKMVHKRDIDEIYVNNYNIEWLLCWNANMDLQLCLDFYAVITYISDYFSKDDSGTLGYIKEALRKADNESLKTKLSLVVQTFLTHRQIGESEAFFKILSNLHLKWSNIEALFVPTGFPRNKSNLQIPLLYKNSYR